MSVRNKEQFAPKGVFTGKVKHVQRPVSTYPGAETQSEETQIMIPSEEHAIESGALSMLDAWERAEEMRRKEGMDQSTWSKDAKLNAAPIMLIEEAIFAIRFAAQLMVIAVGALIDVLLG